MIVMFLSTCLMRAVILMTVALGPPALITISHQSVTGAVIKA